MTFESSPIDMLWYERLIKVVITDSSIIDQLKLRNLEWEEFYNNCDGIVVKDKGVYTIIILEEAPRSVVLHECIHAINMIRSETCAEFDLNKDETYVREVAWLQEQVLTMWDNYFKDKALKQEEELNGL